MKMNRREFLRGTGMAGAAAAMGWLRPGAASASNEVFRMAYGSDLRALDPANTLSPDDSLARSWCNGLLRFKPGSGNPEEFELDLAEKFDVGDDNKTYTFQLRKGVQIHNGRGELTSADVKWSFDRMNDERLASINRGRFQVIDGIETPDRHTVRFYLKEPDSLFIYTLLNFRGGFIVARAGSEGKEPGKMLFDPPLATGPFKITEIKPRQVIVLERHDQYFRGPSKLKRVEFPIVRSLVTRILSLKKGELDATYLGPVPKPQLEGLRSDPDIVVDIPDSDYNTCLHFNLTMKPMDDKRVRQAIAYAINRDDILKLFEPMAKPLYGPVSPTCVGALQESEIPVEHKYPYNAEKAKALLKEAGYGSGLRLETVASTSVPHVIQPLQVVQQHLARVGVDLKLHTTDTPGYLRDSRANKYPLNIYGGKRFPHAYDYLFEWFHTSADVTKPTRITNISRYGAVGRNVDAMLDGVRRTSDRKRQAELLKQAQLQILEDLPAFPLYIPLLGFARRKNVDLGYNFQDTTAMTYNLTEKSQVL